VYPDSYLHRMVVNEFLSWRRKWARIEPSGVIEVMGTDPDPAGDVTARMELLAALCKLPKPAVRARVSGGQAESPPGSGRARNRNSAPGSASAMSATVSL